MTRRFTPTCGAARPMPSPRAYMELKRLSASCRSRPSKALTGSLGRRSAGCGYLRISRLRASLSKPSGASGPAGRGSDGVTTSRTGAACPPEVSWPRRSLAAPKRSQAPRGARRPRGDPGRGPVGPTRPRAPAARQNSAAAKARATPARPALPAAARRPEVAAARGPAGQLATAALRPVPGTKCSWPAIPRAAHRPAGRQGIGSGHEFRADAHRFHALREKP
mmetsp:Transcript_87976/g.249238  ORF Transcript_87976/g.249238 Transcript_87976/m.249238 type:complete len:222 (+) Transcript_87976:399-1064(+)